MKKNYSFLAVFAMLVACMACTPEDNNGGNQNNPDELTVTGEALDITEYSATLTGYANLPLEFGDAEVGIMYDKSQSFDNANSIVATGLDGNNKFTVTAKGLIPSTKYFFKSYVKNGMSIKYGTVKSFITKESKCPVGAVDMGMVITREDGSTYSLYWAKSNLSESGLCAKPEDFGDYYAWGETAPYYRSLNPLIWKDGATAGYDWASYKWWTGVYYGEVTRYGPSDNKTEFKDYDYVDDAARKKLGGNWRTPTDAEWTELKNNCTWTWTDNYNGTGVKGRIVTANNGNSIFLPATGLWEGTTRKYVGSNGFYWSSSASGSRAWHRDFHSSDVSRYGVGRVYGESVRPVSE